MTVIDKSSQEKQDFLRTAGRNHLLNFCQLVDKTYDTEWFHERIASTLERALTRTIEKKKTRIILSIPPRHGKTQLASIYFPAWALGKHPNLKFILSTYGAELSEEIGMKTRDVISSESYANIFSKTTLKADTKSKAKWMTNGGGSYTAVGIGGAVTGKGADIIIIDDPHKDRKEAESELARKSVWDYYRSTLYTRLEGYGTIIVIMQRWRADDLVGLLLEEDKKLVEEGKSPEEWEVINFPAIADTDEYGPSGDLLRTAGEALWPSKYPTEFLALIKQQSPYFWACTPAETPILMHDWSQKKISEIVPGDKIIGFKDNAVGKSVLTESKVINVFQKEDVVWNFIMKSGRKVRCTKDHRWFRKKIAGEYTYGEAHIGGKLMWVTNADHKTTNEEAKRWGYLAGIVDGEGCVSRRMLDISQSMEKNPHICKKIKSVLDELHLEYTERLITRPNWGDEMRITVKNANYVFPMLIHTGEPAKSDKLLAVLKEEKTRFIKDEDEIIGMVQGGVEKVYAIETETGNYVAWGYASSNSQYMQDPIYAETQEFKQDFFKYFDEETLMGKYLKYYTLVDPAISQRKNADNTVVLTVAKEVNGPNFYRIREDAGHFTPQQTVDLIFKHAREYRSDVWLETVAYQASLKYLVKEQQTKDQIYFPVFEVKQGKKEERIRGLLGLYQNGVIWHRKGDTEYELELLHFPRGKHDDRADCMSFVLQAVDNTRSGRSAKQLKPHWLGFNKKK